VEDEMPQEPLSLFQIVNELGAEGLIGGALFVAIFYGGKIMLILVGRGTSQKEILNRLEDLERKVDQLLGT
jgi:hypothetical protein